MVTRWRGEVAPVTRWDLESALIPLISLGIPGSVIDAILLGALVVHGLQPGPLLFAQNPDIVYTIMSTLLVANYLMFGLMILATALIAKLIHVPRAFLNPVILSLCVVGSYALSNRMFDVWVMLAFGLIGSGLRWAKIPLAPLVIGFVLAPVAEEHLAAGLMTSGGSYLPIVTRPISLVLVLLAAAVAIGPAIARRRAK